MHLVCLKCHRDLLVPHKIVRSNQIHIRNLVVNSFRVYDYGTSHTRCYSIPHEIVLTMATYQYTPLDQVGPHAILIEGDGRNIVYVVGSSNADMLLEP